MVYELYVDSLFTVNFVMNLYLLILVNRRLMRTATRVRMLLGAGAGAIVYLLAFFVGGPAWIKWPAMFLVGTGLMVELAFRPRTVGAVLRILRQLFQYSFLIGGLLLFAGSIFPAMRQYMARMSGVLGMGAVAFMLTGYFQGKDRRAGRNAACKVRLINGANSVSVSALVDSGNSLREPVSGKPVSVIDVGSFRALWGEQKVLFRAVPYHSIGRKRGILRAYLLPELEVETEGIKKCLCNVYVAVSEEECAPGMILNPRVLDESESGARSGVCKNKDRDRLENRAHRERIEKK